MDSVSIKIFELNPLKSLKIFFCKLIISISDICTDIHYNGTFCIYRPAGIYLQFLADFQFGFRPLLYQPVRS